MENERSPRFDRCQRCQRCTMRTVLCLCPEFPDFSAVTTQLVLIIHYKELLTTTNTGRLAAAAWPHGKMIVRGLRKELNPAADTEPLSDLVSPSRQPLLLFPSPESVELTPEWASQFDRPFTLIVPDGSWRQAKRIGRREPTLAGIPHVKLTAGAPSKYHLRNEPNLESVCTIEAIARAMGVLEGPAVQSALEDLFQKMVDRHLWGRGIKSKKECLGGIPEAAVQAALKSGNRNRNGNPN